MIAIRHRAPGSGSAGRTGGLLARVLAALRRLAGEGGYRPEKHYMRGPGPKSHSHGEADAESDS